MARLKIKNASLPFSFLLVNTDAECLLRRETPVMYLQFHNRKLDFSQMTESPLPLPGAEGPTPKYTPENKEGISLKPSSTTTFTTTLGLDSFYPTCMNERLDWRVKP